ncbi:MAG: phage tail length tape measure family protein [Alphaproteobacteria bacterium]|nr:phage tail length tape measure family protein [Alphaproteobacteria bacterium]MBR1599980.1 phage tail length tape measure family protein [Alphaproteobacteria bacterium]
MADVAEVIVKGNADFKNANASLDAFNNKASKSAKKADLLNASIGKMSDTMEMLSGDFKNVSNTLAQGFDSLGKKLDTQIQRFDRLSKSIRNAKQQHKEFSKVQKESAAMADKMTGNTTRGAAQANRFNSGNFLAQFQDIAVTSAMGMNPMLIAMQQGTQLQYILAQSKAPLKDFIAGLKSAFSMTGLLAIGLTGVVAALIQMVDWTKVTETVTKGLAITFKALRMTKIAKWFENLIDYSKEAWGAIKNLLNVSKDFNNEMDDLLDKNFLLETELLNPQGLNEKELQEYIYTQEKYGKLLKDLDKQRSSFVNDLLSKNLSDEKYNEIYNAYMKDYEIERQDAWLKAQDWATAKIKNDELKKALDARNESQKKSLSLTKSEKTEVDKVAQAWDDLQKSSQNKIDDLITQRSLIGAGSYEKTYVETLTNLKREAENAGIDLYSTANGKTIYDTLNENAQATAALTEENERLNASYEFTKSTVKGFFSDMRQGLRDGQSAWETFGNAVTNVLDKILDKIMDMGVDALFTAGTGYFGKSAMSGFGMFGGLGAGTNTTGIGGLKVGQSSGNLTYLGNVAGAANGGVFSNGIYSSPTLFKFAKGGKFGVMGEAGPEAVMPLKRAPDGSLGVRADNSNASPVVVNVINNSNAQAKVEQRQTSQGMEIDVMIDQLVAEKMSQPGTSSNNALRAFNNQKLIAR